VERRTIFFVEAQTLNCPMCGAAASTDATKCDHCGARLATVSCPSCFGMMFVGSKFCSHCGAPASRAVAEDATPKPCPRCRVPMKAVTIGAADLRECPKCEGLWADKDTLQQICIDREKQAAILGMPTVLGTDLIGNIEQNIRYLPCPICRTLMNRVNFSRCSGVIVDVCARHGTWFDKDELRRIVEFIRAGGVDKARAMEIDELERRRRELDAARWSGGSSGVGATPQVSSPSYEWADLGISVAGSLLKAFLDKK